MNKKLKCMEYYFDSKKYNEIDVIEKIGLKKMEFPKKKINASIELNEYGTYVVKLEFLNNQIALIKHNIKRRMKNKSEIKSYGQYRETRKFSPI